jgi:ABC-2 type transport system permease protein
MLTSIAAKAIYDQRRALVAWTLSLVGLVAMYAALWPSIRDQPTFNDYLDQMPAALRSLFAASGADLSTPVGYVQVELLSLMAPLLLIIYSITAGAAAVAGEEDRHTLELLLANPVSRSRIVLEKLAALSAGAALLGAGTAAALLAAGPLAGMSLPAGGVVSAVMHLTLLGIVFGSMALAVGAGTGRAGLSRAVPAVAAVLAYVVNGLAPVVGWLRPVQCMSPFYQYAGHDPLRHGLSWPAVVVAVLSILVMAGLAMAGFHRRDIAA